MRGKSLKYPFIKFLTKLMYVMKKSKKSKQKRKEAQKSEKKREKKRKQLYKNGGGGGSKAILNFIKKQAFCYRRASLRQHIQMKNTFKFGHYHKKKPSPSNLVNYTDFV